MHEELFTSFEIILHIATFIHYVLTFKFHFPYFHILGCEGWISGLGMRPHCGSHVNFLNRYKYNIFKVVISVMVISCSMLCSKLFFQFCYLFIFSCCWSILALECQFLLYNNENKLRVCILSLLPELPSHPSPTPHPTPLGCSKCVVHL